MTLDRYPGLFGDELDAVAGRLDEAARDSRGAPGAPLGHRDSGDSQPGLRFRRPPRQSGLFNSLKTRLAR
jgi:hypothetical protein